MSNEFLTVAEIAKVLKVNQQTVRNWIDRGELSSVRVGARRVRVRQSQLDAFLAVSETSAGAEGDPWDRVRRALSTVRAAVSGRDVAALESAISELAAAARELD